MYKCLLFGLNFKLISRMFFKTPIENIKFNKCEWRCVLNFTISAAGRPEGIKTLHFCEHVWHVLLFWFRVMK